MSEHTLHITKVADNESDDVEWTIACDGRPTSCEVWYECRVDGCMIPGPYDREADDPEDGMGTVTRHGVEHQYIEGVWMTASGRCATLDAALSDAVLSDAVWEIAANQGVGDWPVLVDYVGDGCWCLIDLTDEPEAER